jgi:hypothetical protein
MISPFPNANNPFERSESFPLTQSSILPREYNAQGGGEVGQVGGSMSERVEEKRANFAPFLQKIYEQNLQPEKLDFMSPTPNSLFSQAILSQALLSNSQITDATPKKKAGKKILSKILTLPLEPQFKPDLKTTNVKNLKNQILRLQKIGSEKDKVTFSF